jgi:hypothetical protein
MKKAIDPKNIFAVNNTYQHEGYVPSEDPFKKEQKFGLEVSTFSDFQRKALVENLKATHNESEFSKLPPTVK